MLGSYCVNSAVGKSMCTLKLSKHTLGAYVQLDYLDIRKQTISDHFILLM